MLKTHTKRGRLTAYGLSCGYVERYEDGPQRATLSYEHGAYHVVGFTYSYLYKHDNPQPNALYYFNVTFRTLTDARIGYGIAVREIKYCAKQTAHAQ